MRAAPVLGVAIVAVSILNGAETFLRRVGLSDKVLYERAWAAACGTHGTTDTPFGLGRRCAPGHDGRPFAPSDDRNDVTGYVFGVRGWGLVPKLAKDLVLAAVVAIGLVGGGQAIGKPAVSGWLLWGLAGLVTLRGAGAVLEGDWVGMIAGSRSFLFVPVALFGAWVATDASLETLGRAVTSLLGVQVALTPLELIRGLPLHRALPFWGLPGRMAGTLVMPNSLGVLAAVGLAFVLCFVRARRWRIAAAVFAVALVALSGSAAGWVVLALLAILFLFHRVPGRTVLRVAGAVVVAGIGLALVPRLVNRTEDLWDSAASRQSALRALAAAPARQLLLGERLGAGSNTEVSIGAFRALAEGGPVLEDPGPGDSLLGSVLRQTGLCGVVLLFSAVAFSVARDPAARPFLLAIAACGLVSSLGELFPANLLLGLVLARRTAEK